MKTIKYLLFAACIFCVSQLHAQKGEVKMNLQYNYALPLGSFKTDVISKNSPRGFSGDILYNINNKFSAGLGFGFQDFYEKYPRALYNTGDKEVTSAVLSNSVQVMPVLAKAEFRPVGNKNSLVQPYLSVGAGLGITSFTQYLGEFGGTDNSAGLMLQGSAGVQISLCKTNKAGLRLGANYNMVSYKRNGFTNFNNLGLSAGVFFPLH